MPRHPRHTRRLILTTAALATLSPLTTIPSRAVIVTWAVDADGQWTTATNWSSNPALPAAADDVTINRPAGNFLVTLSSGTQSINTLVSSERLSLTAGTLNLAAASTLSNTLTVAGGTLGGTGALTLTAAATFDNGTLTSTVVGTPTNFGAGLTITGAGAKAITRRTLTNTATTTWNAGGVSNGFLSSFVNSPGATFNNTFDGNWFYNLGGGISTFTNQGTFTKSAGAGTTTFTTIFDNAGTVNVNSGTLALAASSTHSGAFQIAAGSTLNFSAGTHQFNTGTSATGAGTLLIGGATLTVNAPVTVSSPFLVSDGTQNGAGTLTLAAPATWAGGNFSGAGDTLINANLTINTAAAKGLIQRTLTNQSTTTWSAGGVSNGSAATFVNAPGATFDNTFDGNWAYNLGGGLATFSNQGNFTKSAGAGVTSFTTAFNNTGTVNVNSGTLQLAAGGVNSAAFAIAPGATLQFAATNYNLNSGTTITGPASSTLSLPSGTLTVNATMTLDAPLSLTGGTLTGPAALTLADPTTWTAGTIAGTGSTTFVGTLTIATAAAKALSQRTLVNSTLTNWTGGGVSTGALANFINPPGATFDNSFDGNWAYNLGGGQSTFTNQGTFTKSAGAGVTSISSAFNNSGTANVNSGTLQIAGGGANSGAFVVAAPGALTFFSTAYAFNAGTTLSGAGTASVGAAATLTVNAPMNFTVAQFVYDGGTVNGPGTLTHASPATWASGTIAGAGTTNINAGLTIDTAAAKTLSQRTINNNSNTTWSGGGVSTGALATFVNAPGASFNNTFDGNWFYNLGGGQSTFTNQGTFTKSAGAGVTTISSLFANTGSVNVFTGTLALSGGGTHAGALSAAAPATLNFAGGTHQLNTGATLSGPGAGSLAAATTLTANAPITFTVSTFNFTGGTQNGAGSLTLTGTTNWNDTVFSGTGATNFNGPLNLTANVARTLSQRTLTATGTTTWSAGSLNTGALANFTNAPTGNFNNTFDGSWLYNLGGGISTFTNQGTFTKSAGAGTTTVTSSFSNTGTVNANSGTLSLSVVAQHVGNALTAGTWNASNATLLFPNGVDITTINPAASVRLSGPSSAFARINALANNQGSFAVTDARNFATAGNLANSGTLTAGANSTLAVNGNLDNSGTAVASGGGTLSANSVTQLSGTTLTAGSWIAAGGTLSIVTGSNISTIGPAAAVQLAGPGSVFAKINSLAANQGTFTLTDGRTFTTAGNLANSGILTVGATSTLKVVGTLTNSNAVDLATGTLLLDYTGPSPIDTLRAQLLTGRAGGAWTGPGVRSSSAAAHAQLLTAIAYAEASTLLGLSGAATANYAGLPVDATTLLTKYTYYGDANMNGRVDRDDFTLADRGLALNLTGWINGDFNYDNTINISDFLLLDRTLALQGTPLSPTDLALRTAQFGPTYAARLQAFLVPEPSLLILAFLPPLLRRRR